MIACRAGFAQYNVFIEIQTCVAVKFSSFFQASLRMLSQMIKTDYLVPVNTGASFVENFYRAGNVDFLLHLFAINIPSIYTVIS